MGYFSWDCKGCNHSIREGQGWMGKAVVQGADGDTASGAYDGYGRLSGSTGETELTDMGGKFAIYHKVCFILLGRPEYSAPSRSARDQGTPPSDEFPEPRNADDLRALKELADAADRKEKAQAARRHACGEAELKLIGSAANCPHCRFNTFFVIERNGTLLIRCPNRDCTKLRVFPAAIAPTWRALAAEYADQPVIWDDRKIGPNFEQVESILARIRQFEGEDASPVEGEYIATQIARLRKELVTATAEAQAREDAEVLS